jgi:cation transport ATPase
MEHDRDHYRHDPAQKRGEDARCTADIALASGFRAGRAYKVRGLDCAEEVAVLRQAVGPLVGGTDRLVFDVLNGRMAVTEEACHVADEAIIKAVAETGMSAARWTGHTTDDETDSHRSRQVLFTAASGAFVLIGLSLHVILAGGFAQAWKLFEVRLGSRFIVAAGERIPLDGRVTEGNSAVNQAPITGESVPAEKQPGAEVFAGTINGDGTLIIRVTKTAEDTTLARIIHMVEAAHARRAPSEQWVERFARVYTPAVMALAFLVFLLPPIALGQAWDDWLYRSLVLLVIACPCALVISTPVSIIASHTRWRVQSFATPKRTP